MREDMPMVLDLLARGAIETEALIRRRHPLESVTEAYAALAVGKIVGRALIVMD